MSIFQVRLSIQTDRQAWVNSVDLNKLLQNVAVTSLTKKTWHFAEWPRQRASYKSPQHTFLFPWRNKKHVFGWKHMLLVLEVPCQGAFNEHDRVHNEGWAQDCSNSNIFLKPLFRGNFDPFVNNANLGAIAHMSNGT